MLKFAKLATLGFENFKVNRRRAEKEKVDSWENLKKQKMKDKWVSKEYEQEQYLKLTHLSQEDGMHVEDYITKFEKFCLISDLQEKEAF